MDELTREQIQMREELNAETGLHFTGAFEIDYVEDSNGNLIEQVVRRIF